MKDQIDELIRRFAGNRPSVDARLASAADLAEVFDDSETPPYVKAGLAREINKLLDAIPYSLEVD
jgi:hypothetical protein